MVTTTSAVRRAKTFFDAAINDYGIREGNHVRIPMRQCELARRQRVSPSTVGAHLRALGDSVIARHPHIVITTTDLLVNPQPPRAGDDLIAAFATVVEAQARLIELLAGSATDPRGSATDPRGSATELQKEGEEEPSFLPWGSKIRDESATIRDEPRGSENPQSVDNSIDRALQPLHELVRHRSLVPMNNRDGVIAALAPYTSAQIEHAIARITALINAGGMPLRSPFGLLVQWARDGSAEHFPPRTPSALTPTPDDDSPADVSASSLETSDVERVTDMEGQPDLFADELESLDVWIAATHPHLQGYGIRPAMRHALRVQAVAERRASSVGTPLAHPRVTCGTPEGSLGLAGGPRAGATR